jgi:HK97 family phage major capsid protein
MMSGATGNAISGIQDSQNRAVFQPNEPLSILGRPVVFHDSMASIAATNIAVLFGDWKRGYIIRDVADARVQVLHERYADYLQVGVLEHLRSDGTLDDARALRSLQQHA